MKSFDDPNGHFFISPLPAQSKSSYGKLMDEGMKQGMNLFEIDFMDENFARVPYYRTVAGAADQWLQGISDAAASRGLATQFCSASARDVVASAPLKAITQFRGSPDFACGCR